MTTMPSAPGATTSRPRSDGRRILFEVVEGERRVACAISLQALGEMTDRRRAQPGNALECFAAARPRIEALALRKILARRTAPQGVLYIWPDDDGEDEPPEPAAPAAALRAPPRRRTG